MIAKLSSFIIAQHTYATNLEFWSRLFAGIRPEKNKLLPSVTQYGHRPLIDLRPVKPIGNVETALKAKPRDQAQNDLLFKLLDRTMQSCTG